MAKTQALLVITPKPPFPPNNGARVDQWNRYMLMNALGWDLVLATWVRRADEVVAADLRRTLQPVFSEVFLFRNWGPFAISRQLASLPWLSPSVSSRYVCQADRTPLMATLRGRNISGILLDGLNGGLLGRAIASELGLPMFLRAHNVEHHYMRKQGRAARGWSEKLRIMLAAVNLRQFETDLHRDVRWSFDCSVKDLAFWQAKGFSNQSCVPPLFDTSGWSTVPKIGWGERPYDAVYLGNLETPNNVEGVLWFLDEVLPAVVARRPRVKLLIAGSRPSKTIVSAVRGHPEIDLIADPADPADIRSRGRVLINPILTGSGINVKSIEMLFTDSPVVTTSLGVQGLAPRFRHTFIVVDTARDFAREMIRAMDGGPIDDAQRAMLRPEFGEVGAKRFSDELFAKIGRFAR
jgi:polysaccharide biosynthesis protein PslH